MEIKQLIQRQKIERMMKVHKEMRGLDRYREQLKEYITTIYNHVGFLHEGFYRMELLLVSRITD